MTLFRHSLSTSAGGSCPIVIGEGASGELPFILGSSGAARAVVVCDSNVLPLHGAAVARLAASAGLHVETLGFPAGEASKTRETKALLEDRMVEMGCGRDTAVVALGGGVTGDLAGFVAATYMRGVPWVQLPTTLLSAADASIGGKTGVDHPRGKNLVGAFHHPAAVLADTEFLRTLPPEEFRNGLAEVVKAGVVGDAALIGLLEDHSGRLVSGAIDAAAEPIFLAARVKAGIVAADERESGRRKALNFGHTVAHALELLSGFTLAHGRAVAMGMVAESRMAVRLGLMASAEGERLEALLGALRLPVRLPGDRSPREVLDAAGTDKKARRGRLEFSLPGPIGEMSGWPDGWARPVAEETALECLGSAMGEEPR